MKNIAYRKAFAEAREFALEKLAEAFDIIDMRPDGNGRFVPNGMTSHVDTASPAVYRPGAKGYRQRRKTFSEQMRDVIDGINRDFEESQKKYNEAMADIERESKRKLKRNLIGLGVATVGVPASFAAATAISNRLHRKPQMEKAADYYKVAPAGVLPASTKVTDPEEEAAFWKALAKQYKGQKSIPISNTTFSFTPPKKEDYERRREEHIKKRFADADAYFDKQYLSLPFEKQKELNDDDKFHKWLGTLDQSLIRGTKESFADEFNRLNQKEYDSLYGARR